MTRAREVTLTSRNASVTQGLLRKLWEAGEIVLKKSRYTSRTYGLPHMHRPKSQDDIKRPQTWEIANRAIKTQLKHLPLVVHPASIAIPICNLQSTTSPPSHNCRIFASRKEDIKLWTCEPHRRLRELLSFHHVNNYPQPHIFCWLLIFQPPLRSDSTSSEYEDVKPWTPFLDYRRQGGGSSEVSEKKSETGRQGQWLVLASWNSNLYCARISRSVEVESTSDGSYLDVRGVLFAMN